MNAIEFVRWLAKNGWVAMVGDSETWIRCSDITDEGALTEYKSDVELYSDYLKEHPVWKDASGVKPERWKVVIVCANDGNVGAASWSGKEWITDNGEVTKPITHWRELPEGPK